MRPVASRGTPQCLVFDRKAAESEMRRVYETECVHHTVHELEQTE